MQYLSQRLASKPASKRDQAPPPGGLSAQQRERILDATERLVGERGCSHTSIEAIVKAAGVSSVTFYEHFAGKEACFLAAFERAVAETQAEIASAVPPELSWPERFCTALRVLLAMVAADPGRARLCLVEAQTAGPSLSVRFDALLDRVAGLLRGGRALDTAPVDLPPTLEEATAGGLAWLLRERLERRQADRVEELYPKLVDVALAPYLGEGVEVEALSGGRDG